jgi:hypothetical protein
LRLASAKAVLRLSKHWDHKISVDLLHLTLRTPEVEFFEVFSENITIQFHFQVICNEMIFAVSNPLPFPLFFLLGHADCFPTS